ncbi:alpha-mannosidase [Terriglobus albidus]
MRSMESSRPAFNGEYRNTSRRRLIRHVLLVGALSSAAFAQTMKAPDITSQPTLYVVPYAHLDTQWRWEFPQTISEYLLKTMRVNFDYMDRYPHYVFNWTGANRYRLMKEYFPSDYERMRGYIAAGRWYPAGSSVEEGDVNLPSAEGIFRQILYGNSYFRKDFGKASEEYMLPDCFGFPASLPSILAHAGIKGFSTQKLNAEWQPAPKIGGPNSPEQTPEGIPFNVGMWYGPDGKAVIAALNPGGYGSNTYTDLSKEPTEAVANAPQLTSEERARLSPQQLAALPPPRRNVEPNWVKRIDLDGKVTGLFADYHYVGTGDVGGATQESTVKLLEAIVTKSKTVLPTPPRGAFAMGETPKATESGAEVQVGEGPVHVVIATADQLFKDIPPSMTSKLPTVKGDLELINHSAGSLTSQAYHKRWVLKNELLADAAEKASLAASWMGGAAYPQQRLNDAWMLALGGHFHDTAAGTATPKSYEFAWNDDAIVANQVSGILTSASQTIASGLDTEGSGIPVVLFNPLNVEREDVVEADLHFPGAAPKSVTVTDAQGKEVPAQIAEGKVLFLATVPSVGYAVYHVQAAQKAAPSTGLKVTNSFLENARYLVKLNADGDVSSIYDKQTKKELLSAPVRLAISNDKPKQWPAWNMDFDQEQAAPRSYVAGKPTIRIKENGPVRVALEITREAEGSKFVQTISLSAGNTGNRVVWANNIDWKTLSANLKATFPLSASNENATYNWDLGTVQRPNANERQFEVASHKWIDLQDRSGSFGATILTDFKNASDKPNDNTIRLTLLRSPGLQPSTNGRPIPYSDQANQDWGHHEFVFGLAGHDGDWRSAQTDWQAYRMNAPVIAFQTGKHQGTLGKSFSLVHLNNSRIRVLALKKAEDNDDTILRMVELDGRPAQDIQVSFAGPIASAHEVNGQEQLLGDAVVEQGVLKTSFTAYQPKTFAIRLADATAKLNAVQSQSVPLQYDLAAGSNDDTATNGGGFDGKGNAIPAEMLPDKIDYHGVVFDLASAKTGNANAVVAKGQTIKLPEGHFNRVYILAASADGDQTGVFKIGTHTATLKIQDWTGYIGQWDTRLWKEQQPGRDWAISANHAAWPPADLQQREARPPAPRYPDDYIGLKPGFLKTAGLAWYASHIHTPQGLNQPYHYSYLFAYPIDVAEGAKTITLPNNDKIRILAISTAQESEKLTVATSLLDAPKPTAEPAASK